MNKEWEMNKNGLTIDKSPIAADDLGSLIDLISNGTISDKIAKDVFEIMIETHQKPADIVEEKGWKQVSDTGAIEKLVNELVDANMDKVAEIKAGKDRLKGWFVGQVMKAGGGKINPAMASQLLEEKLKKC